jgi:hypothetical protein
VPEISFPTFFNKLKESIHTCTFYQRNTYKCQKILFQFFSKIKEFIHTCTFYLRNTYKCAMTVFKILKKKLNEKKKRKLRTLQGMIFNSFLDLWLPFGSLWLSFGSLSHLARASCETLPQAIRFSPSASKSAHTRSIFGRHRQDVIILVGPCVPFSSPQPHGIQLLSNTTSQLQSRGSSLGLPVFQYACNHRLYTLEIRTTSIASVGYP